MCGRYFWTDEAEEEFEADFPEADFPGLAGEIRNLRAGDYTPAMQAVAITALSGPSALGAQSLQWGFPGFDHKSDYGRSDKGKSASNRFLINARAESVKDRPTFADSFEKRRCVLPAAGFYEWDRQKEKVIFTLPDRPILYLAGIYRPYGPQKRFVILTREANASMAPVHDRMPLILSKDEVKPWVSDAAQADYILSKQLPVLRAERPYEQITFEW